MTRPCLAPRRIPPPNPLPEAERGSRKGRQRFTVGRIGNPSHECQGGRIANPSDAAPPLRFGEGVGGGVVCNHCEPRRPPRWPDPPSGAAAMPAARPSRWLVSVFALLVPLAGPPRCLAQAKPAPQQFAVPMSDG